MSDVCRMRPRLPARISGSSTPGVPAVASAILHARYLMLGPVVLTQTSTPERANLGRVGTSVPSSTSGREHNVGRPKSRLRCSGSTLRGLVSAYMNNPGWRLSNKSQGDGMVGACGLIRKPATTTCQIASKGVRPLREV